MGRHKDYENRIAGRAMTKLKDLKTRFMKDPEFRKEYARADDEYALTEAPRRTNSPKPAELMPDEG